METHAALRICAGSTAEYTDVDGRTWKADAGFAGGTAIDHGDIRIASVNHAPLYRRCREGMARYEFDTANGRYDVLLHFAECDPRVREKGKRVFSVTIGDREFPDIDVWNLTTGRFVPYTITADTVVKNGRLVIAFKAVTGLPIVSAIEIIPWTDPPSQQSPSDSLMIEDFSSFDPGRTRRDLINNEVKAATEPDVFVKGLPALRIEYSIDTSMPYGDSVFLSWDRTADLGGYSSLRFLVKPDGSNRRAAIVLHNGTGRMGAFAFMLSGTEPREIRCSLKNMGTPWWWFNEPGNPSFDGPITAVSVRIWFAQTGELGKGAIYIGDIAADREPVAPVLAPPGPDERTVGNVMRIENFDSYTRNEHLWDRYGWTMHGGMIAITLDSTVSCDRPNSMRMDYYLGKRSYAGWVMFRKLDLRQYNVIRFWVKPDDSGNMLKIFFAIGGRYEWRGERLYGTTPRIIEVPFRDFLGHYAEMNTVVEIAFWVERIGDSEGGTIRLDQIEVARNPNFGCEPAPTPAPVPIPGDRITRIDCGSGNDVVDKEGNTWLSDRGYWWGNPSAYGGSIDYNGDPQAAMLRTERFGLEGYGFAVPDGEYTVRLHFAESWEGARLPGRRVFGLRVNGVRQKDVDVFAETGALFTHLVREVPVSVDGGKIEIVFDPKANHPKIDGIEIVPKRCLG